MNNEGFVEFPFLIFLQSLHASITNRGDLEWSLDCLGPQDSQLMSCGKKRHVPGGSFRSPALYTQKGPLKSSLRYFLLVSGCFR